MADTPQPPPWPDPAPTPGGQPWQGAAPGGPAWSGPADGGPGYGPRPSTAKTNGLAIAGAVLGWVGLAGLATDDPSRRALGVRRRRRRRPARQRLTHPDWSRSCIVGRLG
jgi:hypothetical protein